jgi:predicted nucleic acid-binding protein
MIFVDTSAWFAAYIATDRDHARVKPLIDGAATRLVTSNFVLAECLNLFRARNENQRAQALGRDLLAHNIAEVIEVTSTD